MRFRDDDELKAATEAWFEDQIDDFYFKGIDCLKLKWAKCTEVKGDYIEKQELRQVGHYTPVASNKMQHIHWLLYNSVLRI